MIHSLSPLFLVLSLCAVGCFPAASPQGDAAQDAARPDAASSSDVPTTLDAPGCATFDALSYNIPDDGLRGPHLPTTYPCLTVGINDACSGDPIRGATIELRTIEGTTTTTAQFEQQGYPTGCRGEYTIRVSKLGFLTATVVARPMMERDSSGNRFSDYVGVRLVPDPDAGR